ncbi:MAG: cysteine--tRNA ligase [Limisphaerales bacterium]
MALKLFNTLSRSVQEFSPLAPPRVGMYCCGPTVYDFAHIGNWRTFVFGDLVRRWLEFKGFEVTHVMNITDVEDKIIKRVRETKTSLREFTGNYETAFLDDLKSLNCREPHRKPRATEYIPEIIALIEKLLARGIAYQAPDGSVYFSIEKYRGGGGHYGQLLNLNFDEMRAGERVQSDDYAKESIADFALWKSRAPDDGEIFWASPFGEGRPGWHIECSAMSMKLLGESFDLHLGGEDLIFPHHEDEIAQSEGATGKPFVKYWLHGAHLLVEGKKMSKSLGNFFTLRDLLAQGFAGREIRCLLLTAHYRETFNFTLDGLQGAKTALGRIDECVGKLREIAGPTSPYDEAQGTKAEGRDRSHPSPSIPVREPGGPSPHPGPLPSHPMGAEREKEADDGCRSNARQDAAGSGGQGANLSGESPSVEGRGKPQLSDLGQFRVQVPDARPILEVEASNIKSDTLRKFTEALDDDLNISGAWGEVHKWVSAMNKRMAENTLNAADAAMALTIWEKIDSVLQVGTKPTAEIPPEIYALLEGRQAARKAKDFKKSDAIRDELKAKGWAIEDTPKGPKLKKI